MVDVDLLLSDLQAELTTFTADLVDRVRDDEEVRARLEGEWRKAFDANRTGRTFEDWLDDRLTQVAVGWILACVFVRFGEDNGLIDDARIAGPDLRGRKARDAQQRYFTEHPHSNDREYLHSVFPGRRGRARARRHRRRRREPAVVGRSACRCGHPAADAVPRCRRRRPAAPRLHRPELSTRFLGDLYQDLYRARQEHLRALADARVQ